MILVKAPPLPIRMRARLPRLTSLITCTRWSQLLLRKCETLENLSRVLHAVAISSSKGCGSVIFGAQFGLKKVLETCMWNSLDLVSLVPEGSDETSHKYYNMDHTVGVGKLVFKSELCVFLLHRSFLFRQSTVPHLIWTRSGDCWEQPTTSDSATCKHFWSPRSPEMRGGLWGLDCNSWHFQREC